MSCVYPFGADARARPHECDRSDLLRSQVDSPGGHSGAVASHYRGCPNAQSKYSAVSAL